MFNALDIQNKFLYKGGVRNERSAVEFRRRSRVSFSCPGAPGIEFFSVTRVTFVAKSMGYEVTEETKETERLQ
jgi:hypothetical protein